MQVMITVTSGRFGKGPTKRVGFDSLQVLIINLHGFLVMGSKQPLGIIAGCFNEKSTISNSLTGVCSGLMAPTLAGTSFHEVWACGPMGPHAQTL